MATGEKCPYTILATGDKRPYSFILGRHASESLPMVSGITVKLDCRAMNHIYIDRGDRVLFVI